MISLCLEKHILQIRKTRTNIVCLRGDCRMKFLKRLPKKDDLLQLTERKILSSHAVTMATDEYIKKSCNSFIFNYIMMENKLALVDEDVEDLTKSMLASSISPEELVMLLHGAVSTKSGLHVAKEAKEEEKTKEQLEDEEAEEAQRQSTFANLIELSRNSMGTARATYNPKDQRINLKKPVRINPDVINLSGDSLLDVESFFIEIIKADAGLTIDVSIPLSVTHKVVKKAVELSSDLAETCVGMAKVSSLNNTETQIVEDPWANLFNGL